MGEAPFFVVGAGRSGTTLLRLMLDAHPSLALPPESHFVVALADRRLRLLHRPELALERVLRHPRFARWELDEATVRAAVTQHQPCDLAALFRVVFETYAASQGKPRWGDKTPGYVGRLPLLAALFPDARFVHLIRDGRAVAASVASKPSGPPNAVSAAYWWRGLVGQGRRDGAALGERYLEVRYEALIADPAAVLTTVCHHVGVAYDPAMLDYWRTAAARVPSGLTDPGQKHARTLQPPALGPDRFLALPPTERRAVEHACRPLLEALDYPTGRGEHPGDVARAWAWWGVGAVGRAPKVVSDLLRPGRRSI